MEHDLAYLVSPSNKFSHSVAKSCESKRPIVDLIIGGGTAHKPSQFLNSIWPVLEFVFNHLFQPIFMVMASEMHAYCACYAIDVAPGFPFISKMAELEP